ncbi:MAG: chemotaxis protein CheW [Clostridium sp.]
MSEQNEILTETAIPEEASFVERCLTFESGGLTLFLSTNYVTEIINDCSITHLPLVPDHVKGILNLRGQILPIVDIRQSMGKPPLEYTSKTCIIVLNVDDIPIGIVVDSVRQVVDIDLSRVHPIPIKRQQKLLDGMVTMEDKSVIMSFDCHALTDRPSLQPEL